MLLDAGARCMWWPLAAVMIRRRCYVATPSAPRRPTPAPLPSLETSQGQSWRNESCLVQGCSQFVLFSQFVLSGRTGKPLILLRWRGGRVVEGTSLENWQRRKSVRGFESHPLRQLLVRCCSLAFNLAFISRHFFHRLSVQIRRRVLQSVMGMWVATGVGRWGAQPEELGTQSFSSNRPRHVRRRWWSPFASNESRSGSWIFRYTLNKRSREMGLGPVSATPLVDARSLVDKYRRLRVEGIDPIEARDTERAGRATAAARTMTFDQCAEAYIASHLSGWRNPKHAAQWKSTLSTYASPVFGTLPVDAVDVALVMKALEPVWSVKPETAGRVRGRIELVLDWAKSRGLRAGENPARWKGHLDNLLPARSKVAKVVHHPALPFDQVPEFMCSLGDQASIGAQTSSNLQSRQAPHDLARASRCQDCKFESSRGRLDDPCRPDEGRA